MKKPLINTTIQNEKFRIAILNNDFETFEDLCRSESISDQIRRYNYPQYCKKLDEYSFCAIAVACWVSVERFEFIVEVVNTTIQNEKFRIAILNNDFETFEDLCRSESISDQIRRYNYPQYCKKLDEYSFCAISVACWVSVERFEFIVEVSKERPTQYVFDFATVYRLWDIVSYLHTYGFRHNIVERVFQNLFHERKRDAIKLALYYPNLRDDLVEYSDQISDIIDVAEHRRNRALDASVAILSLKKKRPNLIHKDVLKIIAKMIIQKDNVAKEKWGKPRFWNRSNLIAKHSKNPFSVWIVACVLFFVMYYFLTWLIKK